MQNNKKIHPSVAEMTETMWRIIRRDRRSSSDLDELSSYFENLHSRELRFKSLNYSKKILRFVFIDQLKKIGFFKNHRSITEITQKIEQLHKRDRLISSDLDDLLSYFKNLSKKERRPKDSVNFREFLRLDFIDQLKKAGIESGKIAEIGGPNNSFSNTMPEYEFDFLSIYPGEKDQNVKVTDIGDAGHIESNQYDAIFSVSVLEHVAKPWNAATHMSRILKPNGITYHAAPFSYFYHGAPADFWRYTPDAFEVLFSDLKTLKSEFWGGNRRRDNRGSDYNPVDRDGGPLFSVDAFGGWRENWYTIYCGQKDLEHSAAKQSFAIAQTALNLIKMYIAKGETIESAFESVAALKSTLLVSIDQELSLVDEADANFNMSVEELSVLWETRRFNDQVVRPSYNRFIMAKKIGLL